MKASKATLMPAKHVKPSRQKKPVVSKQTTSKPKPSKKASVHNRSTKESVPDKSDRIPRQGGGRFAPGYSPHAYGYSNKKSPDKIGGRKRILTLFDRIIGEEGHMQALEVEIRKCIDQKGMLYFYQTYILPLIPKELAVKALQFIQNDSSGNPLDPKTPEGKQQRDAQLRELFGIAKLAGGNPGGSIAEDVLEGGEPDDSTDETSGTTS